MALRVARDVAVKQGGDPFAMCNINEDVGSVSEPEDVTCSIQRANDHVANTQLSYLTEAMLADLEASVAELTSSETYLEEPANMQDFVDEYPPGDDQDAIFDVIAETEEVSDGKVEAAEEAVAAIEETDGVGASSTFIILFTVLGCVCAVLLASLVGSIVYMNKGRDDGEQRWLPWRRRRRQRRDSGDSLESECGQFNALNSNHSRPESFLRITRMV